MKYILTVLRRERNAKKSQWQSFEYEAQNESDTIASALTVFNMQEVLYDISGNEARKIEWECSCLQKKCGACAMIIDGKPRLACEAKLSEVKNGKIKIEPLRKFPVICDLIVDRSILFENLKTLKLWLSSDASAGESNQELAYEASECLQCGCCLEICPNFYAGGKFFGMSTVSVTMRLLSEMEPSDYQKIAKLYEKHIFEGCGKSLACRDVCPKKIDTEKLLVNANALAVWKRGKKK